MAKAPPPISSDAFHVPCSLLFISCPGLMLPWLTIRCKSQQHVIISFFPQWYGRQSLSSSSPAKFSTSHSTRKRGRRDANDEDEDLQFDEESNELEANQDVTSKSLIRRLRSRERKDTVARKRLRTLGQYEEAKRLTSPSLPLPPFMRPKKSETRFDEWYKQGLYDSTHSLKQKEKEKKAPFATAFAQNPYAQALATAVRADAFTGARLPKACLIDFHLVPEEDEAAAKLLPLSMAAQTVDKQKIDKSSALTEVSEAEEADIKWAPEGSGTYVIAKKGAMDFVTKNRQKHVGSHVVSLRMRANAEREKYKKLEWREDMGDVVLTQLRKIVRTKLRSYLSTKTEAEAAGVVTALPQKWGTAVLDEFDNVGCVLRLKPTDADAPSAPNREPQPKDVVRSHFYANQTSFLGATYGDFDFQTPTEKAVVEQATREAQGDFGAAAEELQWQSRTENVVTDHWSRDDARRAPFLGHVYPLPSPHLPSTYYFPTMRYRKRRVPIYDLSYLMGEKALGQLIRGTPFENVELVAVKQQGGSAPALMWLLKLQAYLAKAKTQTAKV